MLPVAILAGGLATRLRPLTEDIPKALIEIAGRPFIDHQLELLARNGVRDVVLCVGHLGEMIEAHVGRGKRWGLAVSYSYDGTVLKGTGGAIRKALPLLGSSFLVLYGDTYLECDYAVIADAFAASGKLGLMTVFRNDNQWDRSNVSYRDGEILAYDKVNPSPEMNYIDYGLCGLRASVFDAYAGETMVDLATVFGVLVSTRQLFGYEVHRRFYEVGSHRGIAELQSHLRSKE